MSAAESEVLTVRSDGVSVEKSFEPDEFPVPAIAFVIRSERDEPVTLRMYDVLPDDMDPNNVGFHPDFGEEFWAVDDGRIVFEKELTPGEEYTTVYAVRDSQLDTVEQFLVEPEIDSVDPPGSVIQDNSQVVRDVIAGGGSVPGLDDDEGDDDGDDEESVEPLRLRDPNNPDAEVEPAASGQAAATVAPGSVAATLVAELRSGNVDDETKAALRDALGGEGGGSAGGGAVDARIKRLQTDIADLRAYTDALEEFLDENGEAQQLLADLKDELSGMESRLGSVESTANDAADSVSSMSGRVGEMSGRLNDTSERVEETEDRLAEIEGRVEAVADDVAAVGDTVDEVVEERLSDVASEEELAQVQSRIDDVEGSLAGIEDLDDRLGAIESDINDLQADIEDIDEFRTRIQSVFGGGMGDDGDDGDDE